MALAHASMDLLVSSADSPHCSGGTEGFLVFASGFAVRAKRAALCRESAERSGPIGLEF